MSAAINSKNVDSVFISTDDEDLMELARKNKVEVIIRPPELCTKEAWEKMPLYMDISI